MALTAEGKALTEAHRKGQIAIGARAETVSRALWPMLDQANLDLSEAAWMGATLSALQPYYEDSTRLASAYVREYRRAEGASSTVMGRAEWDNGYMVENLHLAGPVRVKLLVGSGMTGTAAAAAALTKFGGIARRGVMQGGRMMIHETAVRDENVVGWRRVTDGDPCTFCAMVASRGPVYGTRGTTQGSVMRASRSGGEALLYHGHCGCTAELVYGHWEPNGMEQLFIDEYDRAAKEADKLGLPRTQNNVLPRMRQGGTFKDSPLRRNKKTSSPS